MRTWKRREPRSGRGNWKRPSMSYLRRTASCAKKWCCCRRRLQSTRASHKTKDRGPFTFDHEASFEVLGAASGLDTSSSGASGRCCTAGRVTASVSNMRKRFSSWAARTAAPSAAPGSCPAVPNSVGANTMARFSSFIFVCSTNSGLVRNPKNRHIVTRTRTLSSGSDPNASTAWLGSSAAMHLSLHSRGMTGSVSMRSHDFNKPQREMGSWVGVR
mmetsp:Transcript_17124/g.37119  ORF Transcript_17124/g.37119 Transcript_17124/m.37119 type:complete len:216 (+) Transcript_17124:597-1244(+)